MLTQVHAELIKTHYKNEIVGHLITDASAIEAREKHIKKIVTEKPKYREGRPKKGEERPRQIPRIEKQMDHSMTLEEILKDLPQQCDVGGKKNTKGNLQYWVGYKLHITVDDHEIPIAGILTSASLADNQVAIPLAKLTAERVVDLYDLMDSEYDASGIREGFITLFLQVPLQGRVFLRLLFTLSIRLSFYPIEQRIEMFYVRKLF